MPIPKPQAGEEREEFVSRCVSAISDEYDQDQAVAICTSTYENSKSMKEKIELLPELKEAKERTNIEFKALEFKMSDDDKYGRIKAVANVMGVEDLGGDIIHEGAFNKTVSENPRVYFLADHNYYTDSYLGIATLSVDGNKLMADIEVLLEDNPEGQKFYAKAKHASQNGKAFGTSIGYSIPKGKYNYNDGVRDIYEVMVHELSATMFPMNEDSRIQRIKSQAQTHLDEAMKRINELKASLNTEKPSEDTSHEGAEQKELLAKLTKLKSEL